LGNIPGSNLFNILAAVAGIVGVIQSPAVNSELVSRDVEIMTALTISLFLIGYGFRGHGRIIRVEGVIFLAHYVGCFGYLMITILSP
jgi:cation:H+ antiporter